MRYIDFTGVRTVARHFRRAVARVAIGHVIDTKKSRWLAAVACATLCGGVPALANAHTATYHLHKELDAAGFSLLTTAGPDAPSTVVIGQDWKGDSSTGIVQTVGAFETAQGVPGVSGTVPAGSVITFSIWMAKTSAWGTSFPWFGLYQKTQPGVTQTQICQVSGTAALTTTLTKYDLTCTATNQVALSSTDLFRLAIGINITTPPGHHSMKVEYAIEGALGGEHDSTITVPFVPDPPPAPRVDSISPATGAAGTIVSLNGVNFGASDSGTITFNGTVAAPTSWITTAITVPVPTGASTGSVIVTVGGAPSNPVQFTVFTSGAIAGTVTGSASAGISGALVEALHSGVVVASQLSGSDGAYVLSGVTSGTYDLRVSSAGRVTVLRTGVQVFAGTTTENVSMVQAGILQGVTTDATSRSPLAGVSIAIFDDTGFVVSDVTASNGEYSIGSLPPGTFRLEATALGYAPASVDNVTVTGGATATADAALTALPSAPVRYAYDAVGRLAGVVNPAGETATFQYDPAGNIVSISRQSSAGVLLLDVSPNNGSAGISVQLSGNGFSSIAAENHVTFNGVDAVVTSATESRVVVTVPTAATTGPLVITSPQGSASASFTVTASTAPVITSFSPTVGIAGSSISIVGSNFASVATDNLVTLNVTGAPVMSATSTALVSAVPGGARTGRLSVSTPFGRATTSDYLFVAPAPYTASQVDSTAVLPFGSFVPFSVTSPGHISLLAFDGVTAHRASVYFENLSLGSCVTMKWYGTLPDQSPSGIFSEPVTATSGGGFFLDARILPYTGTYTLVAEACAGSTANGRAYVYDVLPDVRGTAVLNGPSVPFDITTPGQNAQVTFNVVAGHRVSFQVTPSNCNTMTVFLLAPGEPTSGNYTCGDLLEPIAADVSGLYTVFIDGQGMATPSGSVNVYDVIDQGVTLQLGGVPATLTTSVPGEKMAWNFSAISGQQATVHLTNSSLGCITIRLFDPTGALVTSGNTCSSALDLPTQNLTSSGTYSVSVDPPGTIVGSATMQVLNP